MPQAPQRYQLPHEGLQSCLWLQCHSCSWKHCQRLEVTPCRVYCHHLHQELDQSSVPDLGPRLSCLWRLLSLGCFSLWGHHQCLPVQECLSQFLQVLHCLEDLFLLDGSVLLLMHTLEAMSRRVHLDLAFLIQAFCFLGYLVPAVPASFVCSGKTLRIHFSRSQMHCG